MRSIVKPARVNTSILATLIFQAFLDNHAGTPNSLWQTLSRYWAVHHTPHSAKLAPRRAVYNRTDHEFSREVGVKME